MKIKVVMDSDCLVKLTKGGAKEAVVRGMEVHIPPVVKKETVDDGKKRGHQDSLVIEENIDNKCLHVVRHREKGTMTLSAMKGESEVLSLYLNGGYDAVASDDRRFLKKLEVGNIPFLTPAACMIYLYRTGNVKKSDVVNILEKIRPFISSEEYMMLKFYLEGKP